LLNKQKTGFIDKKNVLRAKLEYLMYPEKPRGEPH